MIRGASLQQAAKLLNIDMFELAVTILKYERCMVGEFSVVPSEDAQDQEAIAHDPPSTRPPDH